MSRTVVVTGANSGIGLAFASLYQSQGDRVIGLCRKVSDELLGLGIEIVDGIDVSKPESIAQLASKLPAKQIDVLINNAGVFENEHFGDLDFEQIARQFEVNSMGPLRVAEALAGHLKSGSKIALITSRMGSIADNTSGAYYGYRMSKAALNAAGKSLANDLAPSGVSVAILHPGFVQTRMVGFAGDISAETAAERLAARIEELNASNTGTFWHSNGEVLPW